MKRFERSNGLDTALYKNYFYFLFSHYIVIIIMRHDDTMLSLLFAKWLYFIKRETVRGYVAFCSRSRAMFA